MSLQKILGQLFGADKDRHRLVVDAQIAQPLHLDGLDLTCQLKHAPQNPVSLDLYLGFTDTQDQDLKLGQYHLTGNIIRMEDSDGDWKTCIRILNDTEGLVKRRNDRWTIKNYPIKFKRLNQVGEFHAEIIDLSAEGIGIDKEEPLKVGEILEISGLASAMELSFREPVRFEVRVLPSAKKAGLMLTVDASDDMKSKLMDFSIQLRQANRFWNNFLDNIRLKVGKAISNSTLPSIDFVARQLRRKPAILKLLVDEKSFDEINDSLAILDRYEHLLEEMARLEEEKKKIEPMSFGKRQILAAFLENQFPTK